MGRYTKEQWKEKFINNTLKAEISGCGFSGLFGKSKKNSPTRKIQEEALSELMSAQILFRFGKQKGSRGVIILHRSIIQKIAKTIGSSQGERLEVETFPQHSDILEAIKRCVKRSGYDDIMLAALAKELNCPSVLLENAIRKMIQDGSVLLGKGDWSLASEDELSASLLLGDARYLMISLRN
jgi:hypothetical protein